MNHGNLVAEKCKEIENEGWEELRQSSYFTLSLLFLINGWPSCFIYLQRYKHCTLLWQFISSLFHCSSCTKAFLRYSLNIVVQFEPTTSCFIFHGCTSQIILLFFLTLGFYCEAVTIFCLILPSLQAKTPKFIKFS